MIDQRTVEYIGGLARLHFDGVQSRKFAKDLESILAYIEKLNALDVGGVKPTSHVLDMENVHREDILQPELSQAEALSFAVEKLNGFYKVPKVIE